MSRKPAIKPMPDLYLTHGDREKIYMSVKEYAVLTIGNNGPLSHDDLITSLRQIRAFRAKDLAREEDLEALDKKDLTQAKRNLLTGLRKKRRIVERMDRELSDRLVQLANEVEAAREEFDLN